MRKVIIDLLLAICGGFSLFLAAPPMNFWPLIFVAVPILWVALRQKRILNIILFAFIYGFTYFYFLFDWAEASAKAIIARIALTLLETLFIVLLALLWKLWQQVTERDTFVF
ncbi:MAG: hypothetical protein SPG61_00405, partial [Arcanobacterium sp.]|nr:hypothetical protein [Arcanobacterium sp.]